MRRYIAHFPQEKLIWSVGSGYGGNALLGKKCFALRIASYMAREQVGWPSTCSSSAWNPPAAKVTYMGAAFPSLRQNELAMMVSAFEDQGYRVWTVGDDIAWMKIADDGYLHAINPESGFFGVAPGTPMLTQSQCDGRAPQEHHLHNVAMTPDPRALGGKASAAPPPSRPHQLERRKWDTSKGPAAHPNSRYTVPANQSPSISPKWEAPEGVPISAFIFGGRRARVAPLSTKPLIGSMAFLSAPAWPAKHCRRTGNVGVVRRDPMLCCLLRIQHGRTISATGWKWANASPRPPKIFHVNWFPPRRRRKIPVGGRLR